MDDEICPHCGKKVPIDSEGGYRFCSYFCLVSYYNELMGDDVESDGVEDGDDEWQEEREMIE